MQCLFCLEESSENNTLVQFEFSTYYHPPTCACRLTTHVGCWMTYYMHKGRTECPICHRVYETHGLTENSVVTTTLDISNPHPIRVVVVADNSVNDENFRCSLKTRRLFMLSFFLIILAMMVLYFYIH